jgi:hypothetical protein
LYDRGIRGRRGGRFSHGAVKKYLTNRLLIGRVEYDQEHPDGSIERCEAKAMWEPLVDTELFAAVEETARKRSRNPRARRRKKQHRFPLGPLCNHCGVSYVGNTYSKDQGRARSYHHPTPKARFDPEVHEAFLKAGCIEYHVVADELETGIKDLIVSQRASQSYEEALRALIMERDETRKDAEERASAARTELDRQQRSLKKVKRLISEIADPDFDEDEFKEQFKQAKQRVREARRKVELAEEFAASTENAWKRTRAAIHETRNIAESWERMDIEDRRILFSHWVEEVHIVVEKLPEMKRANNKTAVVWLRDIPGPYHFPVGRQLSSAEESSCCTQGSDSTEDLAVSASRAKGEEILPSAHAACPRTSDDGSSSASDSTGTASSDPQLPNATETLRQNPERPARRMGDPLENDSQESSSNAVDSKSTSDGDSVPGCQDDGEVGSASTPVGNSPGPRAAYTGSEAGSENLRVKGHTSWQMSHPNTRLPRRGRSSSGMGPVCSMVR